MGDVLGHYYGRLGHDIVTQCQYPTNIYGEAIMQMTLERFCKWVNWISETVKGRKEKEHLVCIYLPRGAAPE